MSMRISYFADANCSQPFTAEMAADIVQKYKMGIAGGSDVSKVPDSDVKDYKDQIDGFVVGKDVVYSLTAQLGSDPSAGTLERKTSNLAREYLSFKFDSSGKLLLTQSCIDANLAQIDINSFPNPLPANADDDSQFPAGCGNSALNRATDFSNSLPFTKS